MANSDGAGHAKRRQTLDGCAFDVMRGGEGPPLLFLHGASGAGVWGPFHERLARRFTVIAPSHPGFDGSDDPPWLDTVGDLSNFYLDFLKAEGLEGVHLVGLSLGGWLAADLAVRDASRLKTVTLMCAAGIYVEGAEHLDLFLVSAEERTRLIFHDPEKAKPFVERTADPANADVVMKNQETTARLVWQPRAYDPHLRKWLHRIDRPTLALWGDSDPLFPPVYAAEYAKLIPGAKAVVLPNCGHVPNLERPDAAADAILEFIDAAAA
ncbi:MAG: alpha/beta hydrolase [Alphaproteobacteria bacterium]